MQLPSTRGQQNRDLTFGGAGTITTGGTAQLLLPEHKSRSFLMFVNNSTGALFLEFGAARAGAVTMAGSGNTQSVVSVAIANGGFGYTVPPDVEFIGGGNSNNTAYLGYGDVGFPSPGDPAYAWARTIDLSGQRPARGHAVLTAGAVTSIVIEDPGAGYAAAPLCRLTNSLRDPLGCASPSATSGMQVAANGGQLILNGTVCPTDQIAVFGATTAQAFYFKFTP